MAVKRSKKLRTEPGNSVCAADILIKTTSNKSVQNKKSKRFENYQDNFNDIESSRQDCEINILEEVTTERDIEENELVLDDKIGFFLKNTPEHIETTQKIEHEDQSEKENLEPDPIPFGISDIEYFTGNIDNLNEGDWLIAKFATKKSVNHFVGRILFIRNNIPTIEFLRKVKNTANSKRLTFTYPHVKDIYEMLHVDDDVLVLPQPIITRRGQVMFEDDFSSYNIQ
ncbi:unnamed protein product [Parnassius apollo]|uniref:(apollo) hypothetical protein n=1 Tax=Parnassius apollo TaxID=110799 RepID=A0A8S3X8L2_PARAO|nr:unnamed protein product [Parnassius apollo]